MNPRRTLLRYLTAAVLSMSSIGIADDTDVFLGRDGLGANESASMRPNVLFILDTSGSMGNKDGGTLTRTRRMKNAFNTILSSINNVNVGLMSFHHQGGRYSTLCATSMRQ